MVLPLMAGITRWYRVIASRVLSDRPGKWAFRLMLSDFWPAFLPMHPTGILGRPCRVFTYPAGLGWDALKLISSVGAFVIAADFAMFAWDVTRPKVRALPRRNPRGVGTLELAVRVPAGHWGACTEPFATRSGNGRPS